MTGKHWNAATIGCPECATVMFLHLSETDDYDCGCHRDYEVYECSACQHRVLLIEEQSYCGNHEAIFDCESYLEGNK